MYIEFKTGRLEKCYEERRKAEAEWGRTIASKYVQAVNLLKAVNHPSDLAAFSQFNYKRLRGDRKGQHSLKLGRRARLIFTVQRSGGVRIARIEEVSTTHYEH